MVDTTFQPFSVQTNAFQVGDVITTLTASAGSYTLSANGTVLKVSGKINGLAGTYTLTGNSASLEKSQRLTGQAGAYTLIGQNSNYSLGKALFATAGSLTLSGQNADLKQTHIEPFAPGFYPVTGQSARLYKSYTLYTAYTSGDRVFQAGLVQDDTFQISANKNDVNILGKYAYFHYQKSGTQIFVVV